jgi:NADP-reducing hydrogenase subunit HndC
MAACKALTELSPQKVIDEVKASGLRGRGGAGFPTGVKWQAGHDQKADRKYIVCNADEGDPGAFMDRSLIEGDPHTVLEGMMLGGYAIGATQGYIYIRAEYPIAIERMEEGIKQARASGFLGKDIFGSGSRRRDGRKRPTPRSNKQNRRFIPPSLHQETRAGLRSRSVAGS